MKYTLLVTQRCNLRCRYCYIGKQANSMPLSVAHKIIDFIYQRTPPDEEIHIGFFGGEPLLAFDTILRITEMVESHPAFDKERVDLGIVTNGTIYSEKIARFVQDHDISFGISCDGPPEAHDLSRFFPDGRGSAHAVANTISQAASRIEGVMVNAVYGPQTLATLPRTVEYLSSLGVRQIHLNPDISATWSRKEIAMLPEVYTAVADQAIQSYQNSHPLFVSFIDSKIAVILRGGYEAAERCRMGVAEMSFTPDGGIYPCERLVGDGTGEGRIGHIDQGIDLAGIQCRKASTIQIKNPCDDCSLEPYCMHWCGCSNFFATGDYDRANAFICASEKAAIQAGLHVLTTLGPIDSVRFSEHVNGHTHEHLRQPAAMPA